MKNLPTSPLERQIIAILAANREDSHATQRQRAIHLKEAMRIVGSKFGLQKIANLGAKHVAEVIAVWKATDQGRRTVENKLADLRWLVRKIGKANLLPRSNRELGIEPGPRHTRAGNVVSEEKWQSILNAVQHPRIRAQLLLARLFGMRFEETALFRPHKDARADRIVITRGTKGGASRFVLIRTMAQMDALESSKAVTSGDRGLIPTEFPTFKSYADWVYSQLRAVGIGRATGTTFHDLRRTYADNRMKLLMMAGHTREAAAHVISRELGHHRAEVLGWYLPAA